MSDKGEMSFCYDPRIFENWMIVEKICNNLSQEDLISTQNVNKYFYKYTTPRIFVKFRNNQDFEQFFNSKTQEDQVFENLYKCFDFSKWSIDEGNENSLQERISQLQELGPIQKLILPEIFTYEKYRQVLIPVSETIKFLKIHLSILIMDFGEMFNLSKKKGQIVSLPNLAHLQIQLDMDVSPDSTSVSVGFISNLFGCIIQDIISAAGPALKGLTLITPQAFILNCILNSVSKLEYLNIRSIGRNVNEEDIVMALFSVLNKFQFISFTYKGNKFTTESFKDFFKILANYNQNFARLASNEGQNLIFEYFENCPENWDNYFQNIPGDRIFYHFPNLKSVKIKDRNDDWINNIEQNEIIQNLQVNFNTNLISPKICDKFPNLTILKIKDNTQDGRINIVPIFENLTNIIQLEIESYNSPIKDADLTGIDKQFIRDALRGNSDNYLCNLPIQPGLRTHNGIANLKELQRFKMSVKNCNIGISLLFAFKLLPKLEILDISGQKNKPVPEDYWRIFLREYSNLKEFNITQHNDYEDFPIFDQIRENLPNLTLKMTRVFSDIRNENDNYSSDELE